jgi:branched-chain amino acid transport system permease protein
VTRITGVAFWFGRPRVYLTLILAVAAGLLPSFLSSTFVHILILTFTIGVAAIAWNIIGGFGGQFSLGNATFFGLTGYTMGILMVDFQQGFVVAFAAGLALTVVAAIIIGYPSFKLTGHYFALATITIVEGLRFLTRYFQDFTGGEQGFSLVPATLRGIPVLKLTQTEYYYLALVLFIGAALVSVWVRKSKLGFYLLALRDDQLAAASLGIDVSRYKMYGWIVCAILTSLSGAMYATYIQFLDPNYMFSISLSVLFAVIPIIGGIGTITGPIVGALLLVPLEHYTVSELGGQYGAFTYVGYGTLLILLIIYAPEGFVPRFRFIGTWVEAHLPTLGSADSDAQPSWRQ